jgi:hypothetical protein
MKHTHMIMYKFTPNAPWQRDEYFGENPARDDANRLFQQGCYMIELYARGRDGWVLVKSVKQNERVAAAKRKAEIESRIPEGCTIIWNN